VVRKNKLIYIDYEINKYTKEWNLENWGLYYWLNSEGFAEFLQTDNANFINSDLEKGIPVKKPFLSLANRLIAKYSHIGSVK